MNICICTVLVPVILLSCGLYVCLSVCLCLCPCDVGAFWLNASTDGVILWCGGYFRGHLLCIKRNSKWEPESSYGKGYLSAVKPTSMRKFCAVAAPRSAIPAVAELLFSCYGFIEFKSHLSAVPHVDTTLEANNRDMFAATEYQCGIGKPAHDYELLASRSYLAAKLLPLATRSTSITVARVRGQRSPVASLSIIALAACVVCRRRKIK